MAQADAVQLYAAGSLKGALTDVAKVYEATSGGRVEATFGPSGLLRNEIEDGAKADIFAAANIAHAEALHDAGKAGPVRRFARNNMCALIRPGLNITSDNLLERMLDGGIKLATSTPAADPSGDYAFEIFDKAEALKPGAKAALANKALKLTGARDSAAAPAGRIAYGWHIDKGRANIFLTYCTNALAARKQYSGQKIVDLPDKLAIGAEYGLTVTNGASAAAESLADFILSPGGQNILATYGFSPWK